MASGVEMLGQMSETEALAGPVSGGNMVVKPNEVPVGGAAMLAKALRGQANKGIGGIYELPSQKAPTPEFMQMAKAGLRQGDPMRGMGPREGLTAYDMANMAGAVEQAGIINFLGEQPEVTAPIRAKSHADAPATQLAYITDAEKQMLLDANMHGSLEGNKPNPGPAGIQSLDDFYNYTDSSGKPQVGGGGGENVFSSGVDTGSSTSGDGAGGNQGQGGYQSSEDFFTEQLAEDENFGAYGNNEALMGDAESTFQEVFGNKDNNKKEETKKTKVDENKKLEEQNLKDELDVLNAKGKDITRDEKKRIKELNKKLQKIFDDNQKSLFDDEKESVKNMDKEAKKKRFAELFNKQQSGGQLTSAEQREIKALRDDKTNVGMFKAANFLDDILGGFTDANIGSISDPNAMSLVAYKQGLLKEDGTLTGKGKNFATQYGDELDFLGIDDFGSYLEGIKGGVEGTQSQRAIDRKNFYLDNKNFTNATSGQAEQLAGEQLYSTEDMENMDEKQAYRAKMFNRKVIEARDIASRDRGGNQNNRRPGVMQDSIAEEVIETPDGVIDEEAQTMKYTSPRTGDKEIDVPLQRRFRTDPTQDVAQYTTTPRTESDILKYMTQGTTGEGIGLEPFSEYQRRRRKAMGLDPLELYG